MSAYIVIPLSGFFHPILPIWNPKETHLRKAHFGRVKRKGDMIASPPLSGRETFTAATTYQRGLDFYRKEDWQQQPNIGTVEVLSSRFDSEYCGIWLQMSKLLNSTQVYSILSLASQKRQLGYALVKYGHWSHFHSPTLFSSQRSA